MKRMTPEQRKKARERHAARVKKQARLGVWVCTKRRGKTSVKRTSLRRKGQKRPPKTIQKYSGMQMNCRLSHSPALVRRVM